MQTDQSTAKLFSQTWGFHWVGIGAYKVPHLSVVHVESVSKCFKQNRIGSYINLHWDIFLPTVIKTRYKIIVYLLVVWGINRNLQAKVRVKTPPKLNKQKSSPKASCGHCRDSPTNQCKFEGVLSKCSPVAPRDGKADTKVVGASLIGFTAI